jgi:hypothetical protein
MINACCGHREEVRRLTTTAMIMARVGVPSRMCRTGSSTVERVSSAALTSESERFKVSTILARLVELFCRLWMLNSRSWAEADIEHISYVTVNCQYRSLYSGD